MENIEDVLIELVGRVAHQFQMTPQEALEVVSMAKITNDISNSDKLEGMSLDEITEVLFKEIALAE